MRAAIQSRRPRHAALAAATAGLVKLTAKTLDPLIGATLALEIMIGVAKMRPLEREIAPTTATG